MFKFKGALLLLGCSLFAFSSAQAIESQTVSEVTRTMLNQELGKRMIYGEESIYASSTPGGLKPAYADEGRTLGEQLKVISANEDVNYVIVPGDTLTISFKDREKVNRSAYKVSDTGEIFVPLLGPVKVSGLDRKRARERVDMMLMEYIREPHTYISVNTDGRIMLFGAVAGPGIYDLTDQMTVMEAIFSAGGFNRRTAEMASVIVIRGSVEEPVILKLDLKKMIKQGDRTDDIKVKPGDFIYIPTSFISNLERFWSTSYGYLMQWYGLGGQAPFPQ